MRTVVFVLILFLSLPGNGYAQDARFLMYDYGRIGLTFVVPDNWEHDGLTTTTKAAFIKQFGWTYDGPDATDIWNAVGSFSSITVDSTLFPSDSAFAMHKMTLFVSRAHTLYRRWLCLHRRSSLFASRPLIKDGHILIREDRIGTFDLPPNLSDANGKSYQYQSGHVDLLTQGHVYTFVHQEKCYEIMLESTTADPATSARLHEHILKSLERFAF